MQELKAAQDLEPLDPSIDTLPKQFVVTAKRFGDRKIAMRKKLYGIWQEYTWQDSYNQVHDFALGLLALGAQSGEKIAIIGDNDPEYYWAEIASHAVGMTAIGVFTDAGAKELTYLLDNSDAVFMIAQDQEQCDKMLDVREHAGNIRKVIYWDERGLWNYDDPWLMSFEEVKQLGRDYAKDHPGAFEEHVAKGKPDDYAIFSYTSGTTGLPKAAMIKHSNLMFGARQIPEGQEALPDDDYVSFSPMAWIAEQGIGLARHVWIGFVVNFPEKQETVRTDIREIAPHTLLFPSRLWESMVSQVQARMADSTRLNRLMYRIFLPIGYKIANLADERKTPNAWQRFQYWLGNVILFAPLRDKLGLRRIRTAYTGGASLSPDVLRFFRALDIELLQLYGSTECQTHTVHYLGDVRLGTVGQPPPGVTVRVTDEGEIAVKSRAVFDGYYKAKEKTDEVLRDGFFYTGDAGYIDDEFGHLIYLDRMSDMIELATGEKFSPQYIEGRLKFNQYIQDVMALGGFDMPYVSALVTIDYDNVARWAEKRGVAFTTMVDLSQKSQVYDLVAEEVDRVNKLLPPKSRIRKFVILHKTFDADEAELTRTRKLRRRYLEQRYEKILNAIYGGQSAVRVSAEVTYQDGRTGVTATDVRIFEVGDVSDLPILDRATVPDVAQVSE